MSETFLPSAAITKAGIRHDARQVPTLSIGNGKIEVNLPKSYGKPRSWAKFAPKAVFLPISWNVLEDFLETHFG